MILSVVENKAVEVENARKYLRRLRMSIETVVEKVEGEVKSVAEAVVAEVKKIEGEVVAKEKAAVVEIKSEEKLVLRELELEFLKSQMEIQRLSKLAEEKSKTYTAYVENLYKNYLLTKVEYVFDGAVNSFKKL
jgi:hypothetical protein